MPIDVHCDCGNVFSVGLELSGKKLRCKTCAVVLKVPLVPIEDSSEHGPPSMEYEVIKDEPAAASCPTCGAINKAGEAACLSCGTELGPAAPGLLEKVPRPVLIAVVSLVLALVLGVVGYKLYRSSKLSGLLATGRRKLDAGDLKAARLAFEELLREDRDNLPAVEGLVQTGLAGNDWKLVKQYGNQLIAKLPKGERRARARLDLGRAQLETQDYAAAAKSAKDAQAEDSRIDGADDVLGLALVGANELIEAQEVLKRAATSGSRDARVFLALAKLLEPTNVAEARAWADKATAYAGKDASIWLECARFREKAGDPSGARGALEKACEADPKSGAARIRLALSFIAARDFAQALASAKIAKDLAPDDALGARALGQALLETGDAKEARVELERAEKLAPEDPLPSFLLGKALIRTNDIGGGVDRLEKAMRKQEKDALAWLDAGKIILLEAKQPERASQFLDKALALEPRPGDAESKKTFAQVRVLLARAFAQIPDGRSKNARRIEELLQKAVEQDPARKEAHLELGLHLEALEKPRAALEALEKGLEALPDDDDLLYRAGVAGIKTAGSAYKNAVAHLSKLVKKNPGYPDAKKKLEVAERGLEFEGN